MGGLNIPSIIDYGAVRLDGSKAMTGDLQIDALLHCNEIGFNPVRAPQALVTFVFDDGTVSDYTNMLPLFEAQGEVACSALVTDLLGSSGSYLTTAQVIELEAAGWEILSHTVTHPDLTGLSESEIREELLDSKTFLEDLGLTVNNFVYPFHAHNAAVRAITREYYRSARGQTGLNPLILDTHNLECYDADDHTLLSTYQGYVDAAEAGERWVIFLLHATDADDVTAIGTLIDYIQAKNISIVTVEQALNLVGNVIDVGDTFSVGLAGLVAKYIQGPATVINGLNIASADNSNLVEISHNNTNMYIISSKGHLYLKTDEGTNTNSVLVLQGKGTGRGELRTYDEDDDAYLDFTCASGKGYLRVVGGGASKLFMQPDAAIPITMFEEATEGETQELQIYGFRTADQLRTLAQSVGKYFADTAEFYGLSNYVFDGELRSTTLKVSGNIGDGTYTNTAEQLATATINFIIDGGGSAITTGVKGYVEIPCAGKLTAWTLAADQSGAIKIDIWKDTYANYPPIDGDSITNGHEPEIVASGVKAQDLDIADWSGEDSLAAGDILVFNVDSVTAITFCTLSLKFIKDNA